MPAERSKRDTAFRTASSSSTINTVGPRGAGISKPVITASFRPQRRAGENETSRRCRHYLWPRFSPVCVNDGAADRKAKSHSLLLRREETLEDLFHVFFRNTATTIGNGYPHCALLQLRSDKQSALRRIMIGHRFAAIHHQVKQYLLKLDPVAGDCGQVLREVSIHSYVSIDQIAAH